MSTLLYGASNNPNTNGIGVFNDESGKKTLVAGLLALIPAESLAAYAFVFTAATTTTTLSNGETQVSFETLAGMDWVF